MRYSPSIIGQGACMGDDGLRQQPTGTASFPDVSATASGRADMLSAALCGPVGSTAPARARCLNRRLRSPRLAGVLRDVVTDVSATEAGRVKVAMAVHRWDDEEILRALRHAFRARQAVPRVFVEAGRSAFGWRNVGVELAQLTYDSTRDLEPALSPRAEAASARVLTYASAHLTIQRDRLLRPRARPGGALPAALPDGRRHQRHHRLDHAVIQPAGLRPAPPQAGGALPPIAASGWRAG